MKRVLSVIEPLLSRARHLSICLILLIIPAVALGYVRELSVSDVTWVYNATGQFRILARIDSLADLSDCEIQFATIVVPACAEEGVGNVSIFRVARPWESQTVSWTYPWAVAGVDIRGACVASWAVHPDATLPVHFLDVTEYVREVATGEQDFGLLVAPSDDPEIGFDGGMRRLLLQLSQSKVHVMYRCKPKR